MKLIMKNAGSLAKETTIMGLERYQLIEMH